MRGFVFALSIAMALGARAEPELEVHVSLEPREVVLHQQALLRVEVHHPLWAQPRWEPPVVEGIWVERLSSLGGALERRPGAATLRTTTFRRALFPMRAGTLEIPVSRIYYSDREGRELELAVSSTEIRVDGLPAQGRPEVFPDLTGDVEVLADLDAHEIREGESVTLRIEYYGAANLWDAPPPDVEARLGKDFEIFPGHPTLQVGERGDAASVRRSFPFELVPRQGGMYTIPGFALAYFDPRERGYRSAHSESFDLVVQRSRVAQASEPERTAKEPARLPWAFPAAATLGALVGTWALWRWSRTRAGSEWDTPPPSPRVLLERARKAKAGAERTSALARALKAGIHVRHRIDVTALCTEEIASRVDDEEALALLRALDQARFGVGAANAEHLLAAVTRYLEG